MCSRGGDAHGGSNDGSSGGCISALTATILAASAGETATAVCGGGRWQRRRRRQASGIGNVDRVSDGGSTVHGDDNASSSCDIGPATAVTVAAAVWRRRAAAGAVAGVSIDGDTTAQGRRR